MLKERNVFFELLKESKQQTASIIIGPRQVGKTTALNYLYNELCVKEANTGVMLDLDIYSNYERVSTYENAIATFKLSGYGQGKKGKYFVFFDEFQRYKNMSMIIKNIIDHHKDIKIYATGSSSIGIKDRVQESLAGRKRITYIYPLNFREFLSFKDEGSLVKTLENSSSLRGENLHGVLADLYGNLEEFIRFGGYPEVVLNSKNQDKKEVLRGIFDLFIKKELVEYLKIDRILEFKKIMQYLAVNNGQKIKYQSVAQISGLSEKTVKHYMELLKEMCLVVEVKPYFNNKVRELVKIPKVYFMDTGVANYYINNFNRLEIRNDAPFLFENHILSELIKGKIDVDSIKYWQDKNGSEVDFVINENKLIGLEVKYKKDIKKSDTSSLNLFKGAYPKAVQYLVNLSVQKTLGNIRMLTPFALGKDVF